ncbi:MAG: sugar ABC transporter permease [Roseiflexaceae bacterium]|nr:sugar ABC transporter permease [Roseiflexaceae bacterium]
MASDATIAQGQYEQDAPLAAAPQLGRRSRVVAWMFVLPALFFQAVWGWYPVIIAFILSLTNARLRKNLEFTGLQSYVRMVNDPLVAEAFRVTAIYSALSIVLTFGIPIFVAILLMEMPQRHMRWMMLLWFLPLSGFASAILWRFMYNPQYGLFQSIATSLGFPPQPFLNDANQVLFWLIIPGVLFFGPGLIYMASLQSVPSSFYEAAEVEGASFWRKIWTISLPRLRPIIALSLLFALISAPQEYGWPKLMTNGGPGGASTTVVMYMESLITNLRFADATALAVLLFGCVMLITVVFRTFFKEDPDV